MSAAHDSKESLHCHHCGRDVSETVHTRSSYRVDYYALHTGDVEPVTLRVDEPEAAVTFLRLLRARNVLTCADCYREPHVRTERELLFRSELGEAARETS